MHQWRQTVRAELDSVRPLLQPDGELATAFPRFDGRGTSYSVVAHSDDDFVGIGEDDERITLKRSDLVVYRLDLAKMLRLIAGAFDIAYDGEAFSQFPNVHRVGAFTPSAGYSVPILSTIQTSYTDYLASLQAIVAEIGSRLILVAPTNRHHRSRAQELVEMRGSILLLLADAIVPESNGWKLAVPACERLDQLASEILPQRPAGVVAPAFFSTPADMTWSQLRIRFLDGHSVSVKIGDQEAVYEYAQMGMADSRSGKPTKQWELLRLMSHANGCLTWNSVGAERGHQKRQEKLSKQLEDFFRISGKPITLTADRKGWRTKFKLEPESDSSNFR